MAGDLPAASSADFIRMSFSGQDCDVYAYIPSSDEANQTGLVYLDSMQTLSVSIFRDKIPVRAIGYVNVKGHTRGPRTIAGSIIFAVMNDHPLAKLLTKPYAYDYSFDNYAGKAKAGEYLGFPDEIPPINLLLVYQNELGSAAVIELIGVDITNDGIVTSIEDLLTENTMQYRARDMKRFRAVTGKNKIDPNNITDLGTFIEFFLLDQGTDGEFLNGTTESSLAVPISTGETAHQKIRKGRT